MLRELRHLRFLMLAGGLCLIGFLIFFGTIVKMFNDTDVMRNGVQTIGQVTDTSRYLEKGSNGDSYQRYRVHFTFQDANGVTYSGEDTIGKETYDSYTMGQSLEIYYYPNNPNNSFTDLQGKIQANQLQIFIGAVLGIGGLISLLLWGYRK